ncbi:alkaline phosphatase [Shewanella woodyi ATCC 51908]|uniref:Alkaline phosphatase n=1 Tax=Shewanella woodyi (strain ATCC 51908 / MS32) TaxID=392500 RepID=B1KQK2_SHEWM|nr:alkaline phosphatase [Shewanella woodyi ATCC 51908]
MKTTSRAISVNRRVNIKQKVIAKYRSVIQSMLVSSFLLAGCGSDGKDGINALINVTELEVGSEQCALGGQIIQTGLDINGNGLLEGDEIDDAQTQLNCKESTKPLAAELIARHSSGVFGQSAAEIVDYHRASRSIFVVNANSGKVDLLNASLLVDATAVSTESALVLNNLPKLGELDVAADIALAELGEVNSLSIFDDLLAVAIERGDGQGNKKQANGFVAFYRLSQAGDASFIKAVEVGALPDNVTFTHDGNSLIVANEGEPNGAYTLDPEGSIAVIAIVQGVPADSASIIDFSDFNLGGSRESELSEQIKINGPGSSVAQDLEPEYISISTDNNSAFVSLQENNAIAVVDLTALTIRDILPLGLKDFGLARNGIDASDKDDLINIRAYEGVYGLYQPDTIASFSWKGGNFIVSANEGDARDYAGFSEELRAQDLLLDANHPQVAAIQDKTLLGRLKVTNSMGDEDQDGDFDKIIGYGGRSFSIWDEAGNIVFDSGNEFARITAAVLGSDFNNHNEESKGDSRSDDKGAEPEALALGVIGDKRYAFIGLERTSGFMIYDITNPFDVHFIDYVVNRDFSVEFEIDGDNISGMPELAGDLGPEGMKFVSADKSPNGQALLIIGNEVSGTTSVYQFK